MTIRSTSPLRMTATEWALLLFLSLLWGAGYLFGQIALAELSPFAIAFSRVALAAIALIGVGLFSGQTFKLSWKVGVFYLALGALGVLVPSILILWSQARIGAGLASLLGATAPLFTIAIAHFLTSDEKMTRLRLGGMAVALVGVAIAMRPAADGAGGSVLAGLAVLAAAFCQACAAVLARRGEALSPLELAAGQLAGASLLALPLMLAVEGPPMLSRLTVETVLAILALAFLSTALGYLIFFRLLVRAGATNVALISLLVPVSALFLAGLALGEELSWPVFAGAALIVGGLIMLDGRAWPRLPRGGRWERLKPCRWRSRRRGP